MKIYVVISDSIIHEHSSHGLHGVYADKCKANVAAISMITSTAKQYGQIVSIDDIHIEDDNEQLELFYNNNGIDIVVSCILQSVQA